MTANHSSTGSSTSFLERLGRLWDPAVELIESDGRIHCPRVGDIDLAACFGCDWHAALEREGGHRIVRCHWATRAHLATE